MADQYITSCSSRASPMLWLSMHGPDGGLRGNRARNPEYVGCEISSIVENRSVSPTEI